MSNGKDEGKKFSGQFPFMGATPFGMQQKSPATATPFGMQPKSPATATPFGMQQKSPVGATPSWQISKLKKTMDFAATDDVLPRDSSDAYHIEKNETEDDSRFRDSDDGLKQEEDKENAEIDGEEKFDDGKEIENDENWEDEEDYFQELAERNALLESALKERIENPFPPVYNQIMKLCDSLANKEKTLKPPAHYIEEIAKYIEKKIATFSNLPKVDNHNITKSNQLMIDGLNLLTEANNCLRNYLNDTAPYNIDMARRFTAQANEFFTEGKNLLLSVKIDDKKE